MVDFSDTPEDAAFRADVRKFLDEYYPQELRAEAKYSGIGGPGAVNVAPAETPRKKELMDRFQQAIIQRGWNAPGWPKQYGGAELTPMQQFVLNQTFAEVRAPRVSVPDVASTIMVHGSDEIKKRFLPGFVQGKERWAQGYSEPGSGSDLASLQTRAVRDGDEFVLNGQKIWTSGAHRADWMFGLFRTDPDAPKHRGITYLLLPMKTPGITSRPMEQINGQAEFNEVFFEDARVSAKNVVGEINRGWYVGATHLDFERSSIGSSVGMVNTMNDFVTMLKEETAKGDQGHARHRALPVQRLDVAQRYVDANVAMLMSYRVISMQTRKQVPNYEASMGKLFHDGLVQSLANTAVRTIGLYGGIWDSEHPAAPLRAKWARNYVGSVAATIGGGTSEIQRNVIATRGLGLPRG